jgi:hypothetical protein
MESSRLWEANSCSASEEIPNILLNQNVNYCVHTSSPLVPTNQITPVHTLQSSIFILSSHFGVDLWNDLFPSGIPAKTS